MSVDAFIDLVKSAVAERMVYCGVRKIKQPDRNQQQGAKSNRPAINDEIRAKEVRLVGADGEQKELFH